jgi:hypothetical protein
MMYDTWDIIKYTKGVSVDDYLWLTDELDKDYRDFHPKYLQETGQFDKIAELQEKGEIPL